MFVCVARITLQIPDSGSLKAKRQILRRVTDRVKARFNVSVAEVEDNELWQKATIGLSVIGNDRRFVNEQMEKIIHFVDEMYVAPLVGRELEIISFGDTLYQPEQALTIQTGERSLAEAEGLGEWERRHETKPLDHLEPPPKAKEPKPTRTRSQPSLSLDEAKAKARTLRNPRDWEKE